MEDYYICLDCGAIFEADRIVKGHEEEKDSCPMCGSWGFEAYREEEEDEEWTTS